MKANLKWVVVYVKSMLQNLSFYGIQVPCPVTDGYSSTRVSADIPNVSCDQFYSSVGKFQACNNVCYVPAC